MGGQVLEPREMPDLVKRAKADIDQAAVTNRDFMSTRPGPSELQGNCPKPGLKPNQPVESHPSPAALKSSTGH
jgi:hypothetical protein